MGDYMGDYHARLLRGILGGQTMAHIVSFIEKGQ